jgi:hypothetical protein
MQKGRRDLLKLMFASSAFSAGMLGSLKFTPGDGLKIWQARLSVGSAQAQGQCGFGGGCAGGGGQCGFGGGCAGQ